MDPISIYLQNLIRFKTVGSNKDEFTRCFDYISKVIDEDVHDWFYREYQSNGVSSRVYSSRKYIQKDEKVFDIILYANIDVVDAKDDGFMPRLVDGRMYGRGAADMKFAVAAHLETLKNLEDKYLDKKIALLITTDEELGGINGVKHLVDNEGFRAKVIIGPNGMPSEDYWQLEIKNKGTIHTKLTAKGSSSHGSRKWEGDNALDRLIDMYKKLQREFDLGDADTWKSTLNLGKFNGGFATNAVADNAEMYLDFRYVTEKDRRDYYKELELLAQKYRVEYSVLVDASFISIDPDDRIIKRYLKIAEKIIDPKFIKKAKSHGSHDLREFFRVGAKPIIFMPRNGGNHTDYEWVNLEDVTTLAMINKQFIEEYY